MLALQIDPNFWKSLEGKPLWFLVIVVVALLVYFLAPKFWDRSENEKKIAELKAIIANQQKQIDQYAIDIASLQSKDAIHMQNYANLVGAYNALRHNDPSLPSLQDIKKIDE